MVLIFRLFLAIALLTQFSDNTVASGTSTPAPQKRKAEDTLPDEPPAKRVKTIQEQLEENDKIDIGIDKILGIFGDNETVSDNEKPQILNIIKEIPVILNDSEKSFRIDNYWKKNEEILKKEPKEFKASITKLQARTKQYQVNLNKKKDELEQQQGQPQQQEQSLRLQQLPAHQEPQQLQELKQQAQPQQRRVVQAPRQSKVVQQSQLQQQPQEKPREKEEAAPTEIWLRAIQNIAKKAEESQTSTLKTEEKFQKFTEELKQHIERDKARQSEIIRELKQLEEQIKGHFEGTPQTPAHQPIVMITPLSTEPSKEEKTGTPPSNITSPSIRVESTSTGQQREKIGASSNTPTPTRRGSTGAKTQNKPKFPDSFSVDGQKYTLGNADNSGISTYWSEQDTYHNRAHLSMGNRDWKPGDMHLYMHVTFGNKKVSGVQYVDYTDDEPGTENSKPKIERKNGATLQQRTQASKIFEAFLKAAGY